MIETLVVKKITKEKIWKSMINESHFKVNVNSWLMDKYKLVKEETNCI